MKILKIVGNGKTVTKQVTESFTVPVRGDKLTFRWEIDDSLYMAIVNTRAISTEQPSTIIINVGPWVKMS